MQKCAVSPFTWLGLAVTLALPHTLRGDEAVLLDGRRISGKLVWSENGRLGFEPTNKGPALCLDQIEWVSLEASKFAPPRLGLVHCLLLPSGEHVTGELADLDDKQVSFHTSCVGRISLPRAAVEAVTQPSGLVTYVHEDFERQPTRWTTKGDPGLSERQKTSGNKSLALIQPGQEAELRIPARLGSGRLGINFHRPEGTSGARWQVEAEFEGGGTPQRVGVVVFGPDDDYKVDSSLPGKDGPPIAAKPGWHRLELRFREAYVLIGIDGDLRWSSKSEGATGVLTHVRLRCVAPPADNAQLPEVCFDDLSVSKHVDENQSSFQSLGRDSLWLGDGDLLFAKVVQADRRLVKFQGAFGTRELPWTELRGISLAGGHVPPQSSEGEHVRLLLSSGESSRPDEVEGVLRAWGGHEATLLHPRLGELRIKHLNIRRLRGLFHGQRIEIDNDLHHLGDREATVDGLGLPRPEGTRLDRAFRLETVPKAARLRVQVLHLKGPADGIATELQRGELRTEVVINGQVIDYLNRHVDRASRSPRTLTVDLPLPALRGGQNKLEIRQTPHAGTNHHESFVFRSVVLEFPR